MSSFKYHALLFRTGEQLTAKIRTTLSPFHCQLHALYQDEDGNIIPPDITPTFILMYLSDWDDLGLVDLLRSQPRLKEAPLIALCEIKETEFKKELLKKGISYILNIPFFNSELQHKCELIFDNEGHFAGSYTHKFIRSFIALYDMETHANMLRAIVKTTGEALGITGQNLKDAENAARLLSVTSCGLNVQKIMHFYDQMGFALPIKEILMDEPSHNPLSALTFGALEAFHNSHSDLSLAYDYGEYKHIAEKARLVQEKQVYLIHDSDDLNFAIQQIKEMTASDHTPFSFPSEYLDYAKQITTHMILYHEGGEIHLGHLLENGSIHFFPANDKIIGSCFRRIHSSIEQSNHQIEITKETHADQRNYYQLAYQQEKKGEISPAVDIPPTLVSSQDEPGDQPIMIDAKTFVTRIEVDESDIKQFEELEEDIFEILDTLEYKQRLHRHMPMLGDLFQKYANILIFFNEFSSIAETLMGISTVLIETQFSEDDDGRIRNTSILLSSLISNLSKWREGIFVKQDAEDIHFLDKSIIADCDQIYAFLHPSQSSDEDDGLELF